MIRVALEGTRVTQQTRSKTGTGDIFDNNFSPVFWCQFCHSMTEKKAMTQSKNFEKKIASRKTAKNDIYNPLKTPSISSIY